MRVFLANHFAIIRQAFGVGRCEIFPESFVFSEIFCTFATSTPNSCRQPMLRHESLSAGWQCDFCGINIALVLYSVMSLNLGNSIDTHTANKYQRLRNSVDWTYFV